MQINTERLVLRPARIDDVAAFHAILSDRRATAFWSTPPHANIAETEAWVSAMVNIRAGEGEDFVVEYQGQVIGKPGLYRFPEIGFIFHPSAWGNGYALEALRAVLERAFAVHGLPDVRADVDPRNSASLRLLTCLGFKEIGRASATWNVGGELCDSVYLKLSNPTGVVA